MRTLNLLLISVILTVISGISKNTYAHCEIPCGIYEDSVRVELIMEHITTIEKSMKEINKLSSSANPDYNQITRWVMNKEEHAKKIQDIVSQYFLHQRIKITDPSDKAKHAKYVKELSLLHSILVYAMKTKQTTDLDYIEKLRKTTNKFSDSYFNKHTHPHH